MADIDLPHTLPALHASGRARRGDGGEGGGGGRRGLSHLIVTQRRRLPTTPVLQLTPGPAAAAPAVFLTTGTHQHSNSCACAQPRRSRGAALSARCPLTTSILETLKASWHPLAGHKGLDAERTLAAEALVTATESAQACALAARMASLPHIHCCSLGLRIASTPSQAGKRVPPAGRRHRRRGGDTAGESEVL
jgi:hypothetical protein